MSRRPHPVIARHPRRTAVLGTCVALLVLAAVGCSGTPPADPGPGGADRPPASVPPPDGDAATWGSTVPGGRSILDGFEQVTVRVRQADGTERTYCLLLARSEVQRQRGLMQVTDESLGGHDGMVFVFDADTEGGFWMKSTLLPLTIAYVASDGSVVSTADMAPCTSTDGTCPIYPPGGDYRYAVEVPEGRLGHLGLDRPGARLTVGSTSCEA